MQFNDLKLKNGNDPPYVLGVVKKKLKKTFWPDVYVFEGPVWNRTLQETVTEDLAIWLLLELLSVVLELSLN